MVFALVTGVFGLRLVIPFGFGPGSETLALDLPTVLLLLALGLNGGFLAGLLGVGGGAIAIAVMVFALGTSQVLAQGIALVATIPTVIVGALQHRRQGTLAAARRPRGGRRGDGDRHPGRVPGLRAPGRRCCASLFGLFLIVSSARILQTLRATRPEPDPVTPFRPSGYSLVNRRSTRSRTDVPTHPERRRSCSPATRAACSTGSRSGCPRA